MERSSPTNGSSSDRRGSWSGLDKAKAKIRNTTMRPTNLASSPSGSHTHSTPTSPTNFRHSSWDDLLPVDEMTPSGDTLELSVYNGSNKDRVLITKVFPVEAFVAEVTKTFMSHFGVVGSQWRIHVEPIETSGLSNSTSSLSISPTPSVPVEVKEDSEKSEGIITERPPWLQIDKRLLDYDPPILLENILVLKYRVQEEVKNVDNQITPIARTSSVVNFFKKNSGAQRRKTTKANPTKKCPFPWIFLQDPESKVVITKYVDILTDTCHRLTFMSPTDEL